MLQVAPRFTEPSADPAWVMPVGSGDLSAMLRYEDAWEIHLSKTDFFAYDEPLYHKNPTLHSPGHVQLSFGIAREAIRRFEQRIDLQRGSVVLEIETGEGTVRAEAFGVMGRNTLVIAVDDTRRKPAAAATFTMWRPGMSVSARSSRVVAREVLNYLENGKAPENPAGVSASDKMFHLGCGTVMAFAGDRGLLQATSEDKGALRLNRPTAHYWLIITAATTYDGKPEANASALLDAAVNANQPELLRQHLDWWSLFWQASYLDLRGPDADKLLSLWYIGYYSYVSVAGGPVLPKFNGGPGLITRDERSWGWGYWWQNTREEIWPLFTGNRLGYARSALDFYDRSFMNWKQATNKSGKLGLRMYELLTPLKPGAPTPAKVVSAFDDAALRKAVADLTMENVKSGYNARSLAQSAELTQLMFEYVAYTGDQDYLKTTVAPWLKETALFYLSYLRQGDDGLYHSMVSDAAEMWWRIKDPAIDLSAARYCFWRVLSLGASFGYEPAFLAAVRERIHKLPPLPTGEWKRQKIEGTTVVTIDRDADCYAPAADLLDDRVPHNQENPELYIVYPLAMVDANSPPAEYARAVNTFRKRQFPNSAGWSQCPVQAARLRLDDTIDVILDHARRHQKYPYGGWNSPAQKLQGSKLGVMDTPYFDSVGVNLTALQEALLQSHQLTTAENTDPLAGGPIVLVPAVRKEWSGQFKLRARGGFLVTAQFEPGRKVTHAAVECPRGGRLTLANSFGQCRVSRAGKILLLSRDPVIGLDTQTGEVIEFSWMNK